MDPDEIFESLFGEGDGEPQPKYRATYRKKRLMIMPFFPSMIVMGPSSGWFRKREQAATVIADLTAHESASGPELSITYYAARRNRPAAELAIAEWAASVGYRRLWLPDGLLELEAIVSDEDRASVKCTTCGHTWSDGGSQFWSMVFEQRAFPIFCPLCGGDLPQWRLEEWRDPVRQAVGVTTTVMWRPRRVARPGNCSETKNQGERAVDGCHLVGGHTTG